MSEIGGSPKSIKFRIPSLPPSMNDIYWHIKDHRGEYQYVLKNEVRLWKSKAKEFVPVFKPISHETGLLFIHWTATNNWYYQNGKVKRHDVANLDKVIVDAVFEKIGIGDEYVWDRRCTKIHSDTEQYLDIELGYYDNAIKN